MPSLTTIPPNFRYYISKLPIIELADKFHVSTPTIHSWVKRKNLDAKIPRKNGVDKIMVRELLGEGRRVMEVAGMAGCSRRSVELVKRGIRNDKRVR